MKPTTDEVIKWTREAGAVSNVKSHLNCDSDSIIFIPEELNAYAALAYAAGAKAMKERAAKVCDRHAASSNAAKIIAEAIRALGDDDE